MTGKNASHRRRFSPRLYRYLLVTPFSFALLASTGCNLCCPPYLDDYATVGGKWARSNPTQGRVGSVFSDPGVLPASAEVTAYPDMDGASFGTLPNVPFSDSGVIIENESDENAPMILGENW